MLAAAIVVATTASASAQTLSEIRINQPGADDNEYIELAATPGSNLDGVHLVVLGDNLSGGSGVIEELIDLTGITVGSSGLVLLSENPVSPDSLTCDDDPLVDRCTSLNFENQDNVTYLLVTGLMVGLGDDVDVNDDGVIDADLDLSGDGTMLGEPWGAVLDRVAVIEFANPPPPAEEYHYGPPTIGPVDIEGTLEAPGHVYSCAGTWNAGGFEYPTDDTPGIANPCTGPLPDAGPGAPDAGPDPLPDAGIDSPDAGTGVTPSILTPRDQPGIICSATGARWAPWFPLLVALGFLARRRRRRA